MNVKLAEIADAANISREGKLNITGITNVYFAHQVPIAVPCMVVVIRFTAEPSEIGDAHPTQIRLIDDDGAEMIVMNGTTYPVANEAGEAVFEPFIFTIANLVLHRFGAYQFEVRLDGDLKVVVPFKLLPPKPTS
jgi:hypothetical protein